MDQILALAKELIRFRTTPGNSKESSRVVRFLKHFAQTRGIRGFFVFRHQNIPMLFLTNRSSFSRSFDVLLQGHLDVVDGPASVFKPVVVSDQLRGRGAIDMKTSCALMIELLAENEIQQSKKHIGLMLAFDEESGSINGAAQWQKKLRGNTLINLDGGHDLAIVTAERGLLKIILTVRGVDIPRYESWKSPVPPDPHQKLTSDLRRLSQVFPHRAQQSSTAMIVTSFATEPFSNESYHIARSASASLVFYFIREGSVAKLLSKIRKSLRFSEVTVQAGAEPVHLRRSDSGIREFQKLLARCTQRIVPFAIDNGASDARFFTNSFRTILITRPAGANPHGREEWCSLRELSGLYQALKLSIL